MHLWIDLFEMHPAALLNNNAEYTIDTLIAARSSSVIKIDIYLVNHKNELIEKMNLNYHSPRQNLGPSGFYSMACLLMASPTFYQQLPVDSGEAIIQGLRFIFNKDNNASLIELKVPPAYFFNNFIPTSPQTKLDIIRPELKNNSFRFTYNNSNQVLRNSEPELAEVWINNKKKKNSRVHFLIHYD